MARRKRPKYIEELIHDVNTAWQATGEKNQWCDMMMVVSRYLIHHNCYRGFNFFKKETCNGKEYIVLAGTADKDEYDFIQLY